MESDPVVVVKPAVVQAETPAAVLLSHDTIVPPTLTLKNEFALADGARVSTSAAAPPKIPISDLFILCLPNDVYR